MTLPRDLADEEDQDWLQCEADEWSLRLRNLGFDLPDSRVTVFTSYDEWKELIGRTAEDDFDVLGMATCLREYGPALHIEREAPPFAVDPIVILVHELLHFVEPELDHEEIDRLSNLFVRNAPHPGKTSKLGAAHTDPQRADDLHVQKHGRSPLLSTLPTICIGSCSPTRLTRSSQHDRIALPPRCSASTHKGRWLS